MWVSAGICARASSRLFFQQCILLLQNDIICYGANVEGGVVGGVAGERWLPLCYPPSMTKTLFSL